MYEALIAFNKSTQRILITFNRITLVTAFMFVPLIFLGIRVKAPVAVFVGVLVVCYNTFSYIRDAKRITQLKDLGYGYEQSRLERIARTASKKDEPTT